MSLFHYTTWNGLKVFKSGVLEPSDIYQYWTGSCLLTSWPKLLFLSKNEYWEPSVQAQTPDRHWEKCGSCPRVYTELGIPCWKFEAGFFMEGYEFTGELGLSQWQYMLDDAKALGSDLEEWLMVTEIIEIKDAWRWYNDRWRQVRRFKESFRFV